MFGGGVSTQRLEERGARSRRGAAPGARPGDRAAHETLLELDLEARTFQRVARPRARTAAGEASISSCSPRRATCVNDKVGAIRFFPDGGSNGGRITLAAGERKYDVDVDWLTGRVAIQE